MMQKSVVLFMLLLLAACASRREVADSYDQTIASSANSGSGRTVIFFLVDGLPISTLAGELAADHLPHIKSYFPEFSRAHTSFPSLTFPAISSLLSEGPVDKHGVFGNQILHDGSMVDFDNVGSYPLLNSMLDGHNVFARLAAKGERTVSFDYAFQTGATVHTDGEDLKAGLSVADKDYAYVDHKTIGSLRLLLKNTPPERWPDFIFVHLIGVDLTSHDDGPTAEAVTEYLQGLDDHLGPVFVLLNQAESAHRRQVVSMLSADHGFDLPVQRSLKLADFLLKLDKQIKITDEGRLMGIYFPPSWPMDRRAALVREIGKNPDIDVIAWQDSGRIGVQNHQQGSYIYLTTILPCGSAGYALAVMPDEANGITPAAAAPLTPWQCPGNLDNASENLYYPYFISNLSHYFRSANHPDAVIITKPGVAFNAKMAGQHGGPTEAEVLVPLLLHNAELSGNGQIPALWELLNFM